MYFKIAIFLALLCTINSAPTESRDLDSVIGSVYNAAQKVWNKVQEVLANNSVDDLVNELKEVTIHGLEVTKESIDQVIDNIDTIASTVKNVGKVATSCAAAQVNDLKSLKDSVLVLSLTCVSDANEQLVDLVNNAEKVLQNVNPQIANIEKIWQECNALGSTSDKIRCLKTNQKALVQSALTIATEAVTLKDVAKAAVTASASCVSTTEVNIPSQISNIASNLGSCIKSQINLPSLKKLSIGNSIGDIGKKVVVIGEKIGYTVKTDVQNALIVVENLVNVLISQNQDKIMEVAQVVVYTVEEVKRTFSEIVEPCVRKQETELVAFMEKVVASVKVCSVVASHAAFSTGKTLVPYVGKATGYAGEITDALVECQGNSEDLVKTVSCLDTVITDVKMHEDEIKSDLVSAYGQLRGRANVAAKEIVSCAKSAITELQVDAHNMMFNFVDCVAA